MTAIWLAWPERSNDKRILGKCYADESERLPRARDILDQEQQQKRKKRDSRMAQQQQLPVLNKDGKKDNLSGTPF